MLKRQKIELGVSRWLFALSFWNSNILIKINENKIYSSNHVFIAFLAGFERRTKYGCEGTTLKIECEEGTVINLVRANFGRFSISICNDEGITDWSVNCMEPRTLRIINSR